MPRWRTRTAGALLFAALAAAAGNLLLAHRGQAQAWHEGFETGQPSWREAGSDAQYRVLRRQRTQSDAHTGKACEWWQVEANGGSYVYIAHNIGRPRVIDELVPSVWIKSDRSGLSLAVRIVLPRTIDPRTGRPLTTVLWGSGYSDVGRWQQLRLEGIPRLLNWQIRALRAELGPQVDGHEAYLDAVLLNVYGGRGITNVWIDDLDVAGAVALEATPAGAPPAPGRFATGSNSRPDLGGEAIIRLPGVDPGAAALPAAAKHAVKLAGSILLVDGRPMFPRVIQHRGEPLRLLKQLGFNAVWLPRPPATELLEEANRLGLWLVCPPPRPAAADGPGAVGAEPNRPPNPAQSIVRYGAPDLQSDAAGAPPALGEIGPQFDCVLAWDLGSELTEADLEATQRWAQQVRAADRRGNRPLICQPRTDLRGFSRPANLLLIDRRPLGTSFELSDYGTWVRRQPLLASPGTPVWTTVQTQPSEALRRQLALFDPGGQTPAGVAPEQVRLLAYSAVAAGSRGLVFVSDSPLDWPDPDTRQRAMILELLNLELSTIEPWAAAANVLTTADSNVPAVSGAVLQAEHARLLLPIWCSPGAQYAPTQSAGNSVSLVVPGVPEPSNAYQLTASGIQSVPRRRVAGGVSVMLAEFGLTAQVVLAEEPTIIGAIQQRAAQPGRRAAVLERELAVEKFNRVRRLAGQLAPHTPVSDRPKWFDAALRTWFDDALQTLHKCDAQLAAGNLPGAVADAQRTGRSLRLVERAYWDVAVRGLASPVTSPAAVSFATLPSHWRLMDRLARGRFGPNLLPAGNFEDLGAVMQAGWRYTMHPAATVLAAVELSPRAAHSGRFGLRLCVTPADPKRVPAALETPPIVFTSPAMQVTAGQVVCIHGWARVPGPVPAGSDGLLIIDSLGGEPLAERIGQTEKWRPFVLYRAAPQSGPMWITFALSAVGEAWLDDVGVETLELPAAG